MDQEKDLQANGFAPPTLIQKTYQVLPQYVGADVTSTVPYLIAPSDAFVDGSSPAPTSINIYYVAGENAVQSTAPIPPDPENFSLSWVTVPPAKTLAAQVVLPSYVWKYVGSSYRTQLNQAFTTFVTTLENLEVIEGVLARGGAQTIAQRTVEALPLSLDELLYYRYGYDSQNRYLDLQPGMRLRIEMGAYLFVNPQGQAGNSLNGFVSVGPGYYNVCTSIGQDNVPRIGFDSFLASMNPLTNIGNVPGSPTGAGGVIDLQLSGMAKRYYRLFYPSQIFPSDYKSNAITAKNNVTLIGADTLSDLAAATAQYLSNGLCAGSTSVCTFFRGRDIIVPEVLVRVNGNPTYVPIGTTVRNLVEREFNWGFDPGNLSGVSILSGYNRQYTSNVSPGSGATYAPIQFNTILENLVPPGRDVFDLPIFKGDSLYIPNACSQAGGGGNS
jgi:hypothetical protein